MQKLRFPFRVRLISAVLSANYNAAIRDTWTNYCRVINSRVSNSAVPDTDIVPTFIHSTSIVNGYDIHSGCSANSLCLSSTLLGIFFLLSPLSLLSCIILSTSSSAGPYLSFSPMMTKRRRQLRVLYSCTGTMFGGASTNSNSSPPPWCVVVVCVNIARSHRRKLPLRHLYHSYKTVVGRLLSPIRFLSICVLRRLHSTRGKDGLLYERRGTGSSSRLVFVRYLATTSSATFTTKLSFYLNEVSKFNWIVSLVEG